MKTTNRIPKAIAVIVIVGLGLLHNMKNKNILLEPFYQETAKWENTQVKSDTIQSSENKFFIYTKSIIKTSIQHLISNI